MWVFFSPLGRESCEREVWVNFSSVQSSYGGNGWVSSYSDDSDPYSDGLCPDFYRISGASVHYFRWGFSPEPTGVSDCSGTSVAGAGRDFICAEKTDLVALELVEVEYVPEKAELDGIVDEEFSKVFEKFNFSESIVAEENDKKDDIAADATLKDSDSDKEERETQQKEKGISNKTKKASTEDEDC